ncbi:MAG: Gfo/Idh/MocA family oxidoreductase [Sedimentisphaerales bacterium]|nr:Gfo/Idh/MocA family oxidoreductase [Sedimentisphaerales bacterium]
MKQQAKPTEGLTRRGFLGRTAAAALAAGVSLPRQVRGANDKLAVGFIGCGGRSQAHLEAVHWLATQGKYPVRIAAVCDAYRPRMARRAEAFGAAKQYPDYRDLIADPGVDVVCIATPDHLHGFQALAAVQAAKDVYCEKPITHWRQFDLTKKLAGAVTQSNCVFQTGTQGMYDSAWRQMRQLIEGGLIGQPIHAECGYFRVGDWGERGMPIDDPNVRPGKDLDWEAFLGEAPNRPFDVSRFFRWRMYEDYSGGPSTDLFPHSLTPVVYMLGVGMPAKVVALGGKYRYPEREVPDTYNTLIEYSDSLTVAVLGTQGNDYPGTAGRGAGGRVPVLRGWEGTLTIQGNDIVFIPAQGSKKKAQTIPIEHGEDFVEYWRSFLECCRQRNRQTLSPMELAYRVQTPLQMGMMGLRRETQARFDPDKQEIVL